VLTLIDCAGSERRHDSLYHSRERQKESTEINSSLWALKECIRARADGKHHQTVVPYRSSNLTRILRESLERKDAQLCVIATVAPNATDTDHTIETLKTATNLAAMDNVIEDMEAREVAVVSPKNDHDMLAPKQWDRSRLVEWMGRKRFLEKDVPDHMDGKQVMRMSRIQLKNVFFDDDNGEKADRLFNFLRAETDKATRAQLERRIALSKARDIS
jgi:kinesin family protein 2/24